jgi:membrane-bound lytic murein transglycosylase D
MKKLLLLGVSSLAFTSYSLAVGKHKRSSRSKQAPVVTAVADTIKAPSKDTLGPDADHTTVKREEETDNKYAGFKNLFTTVSYIPQQDNYNIPLHPMAVSFVEEYKQKNSSHLLSMKNDWGRAYLNMFDNILVQYQVPKEMKYLAVIESDLNPECVSWAGAVGPWQLMSYEGERFGLVMNGRVDERKNVYKSTHVAAQLLRELWNKYHDWLLVIAAYNGGPGRVNSAMKKSGSRNFWYLQQYLPTETRNHVKKFIAAHYIMEGRAGITTTVAEDLNKMAISAVGTPQAIVNPALSEEEKGNMRTQRISGRYNSLIITKSIAMDIAVFNRYNPNFDQAISDSKDNSFELKLPNDKMDIFLANKYQILHESLMAIINKANNTPSEKPAADKKPAGKKRSGF